MLNQNKIKCFAFLDFRMLEPKHPDHLRLGGARHRLRRRHRLPLNQRRSSGQALFEKLLERFEGRLRRGIFRSESESSECRFKL